MQKLHRLKRLVLLVGFLMPTIWCVATGFIKSDGYSGIPIKESGTHNNPKTSSIQASIDGNTLTIIFTENLGQVAIEITTASGTHMDFMSLPTPNGFQYFIMTPGDYIVNFTLPNGDEYYGEFTVTD